MSTTTKDEILPLLKKVFSCEFEFENNKLLLLDKVSLPNS